MKKTLFFAVPVLAALGGCAGQLAHQDGMDLIAQGRQDEGLAKLEQAVREAPDNGTYQLALRNARLRILDRLLVRAQHEKAAARLDAAEALYRQALGIDAGSAAAAAGLAAVEQARAHGAMLEEAKASLSAGDFDAAERKVAQVLKENPSDAAARALRQTLEEKSPREGAVPRRLRDSFRKPVTIEFRDANLRQVLEALSTHSGLNFVLDREVSPAVTVTIFLRNTSVAEALDLILTTRQLRSRVLNDSTLLIYPDTAAKQGEHQELLVRNFFLTNADAKQVVNMLKTVLRVRTVFSDDKLNLVVMRDTPAMIGLAERLVATQDVAEPEVMLELAVLEMTRSQMSALGIQFPNQLTLTPLPSVTGAPLTLTDLKNMNSDRLGVTMPPFVLDLQDDTNASNLLANPRIRTHNREKAIIKIGDRVPVITTTATSTGFISENVQYIDVGLKLEVEPVIFPNDEVSLRLGLEVSSVVREIVSATGTTSYQIGARNAATVLRLKDGETQVLGGLINDDDRRSANRFPGLSRLPIVGRLFSSEGSNNSKTELVLSVTPRIVRGLLPPADVPSKFWSGTESDPRLRGAEAAARSEGGAAPAVNVPGAPRRGSVIVAPAEPAPPPSPPPPVSAPIVEPPASPASAIPPVAVPPEPAAGSTPPPAGAGTPAVPAPDAPASPPVIYGPGLSVPQRGVEDPMP